MNPAGGYADFPLLSRYLRIFVIKVLSDSKICSEIHFGTVSDVGVCFNGPYSRFGVGVINQAESYVDFPPARQ